MNFYEMTQVMQPRYTAIVLTDDSRNELIKRFPVNSPWEVIAHHMTINMGSAEKGPAVAMLGQTATMMAVEFGGDHKVIAVKVETNVPSSNSIKHITIAVNRSMGGKPFQSNQIATWTPLAQPISLEGKIFEVGQGDNVLPIK